MAQGMGRSSSGGSRVVGDYIVGRQIGSGSFSVVWHGRHRVHGTEVAIKEIAMGRLNKKLQESLMSEIFILKRINHPNIIRLHDIIEVPGKIHLVLEYCRGGDLSVYIQRHQRVPEAMAKHFMQQLAAGLQVLRDNNLIHRDLKPQNLLLSTNDESAVLKIADFGFARSLQPRGLAETLCGSPLYMAPEIMQLQKYDAKADLWSVGAILFQLVTGRTPFTGNNQIQLLQNIVKSNELRFPSERQDLSSECKDLCQKLLRRNPVERLTFEEFFNHSFLTSEQLQQEESLRSRRSSRIVGSIPFSQPHSDHLRNREESSQEDCLPFALDYDSSGTDGSPSFSWKKSLKTSAYGFSFDAKLHRADLSPSSNNTNISFKRGNATHRFEPSVIRLDNDRSLDENHANPLISAGKRSVNTQSRVADSLENIDQDYVLVSGPPMDISSTSASATKPSQSQYRSEGFPQDSSSKTITSAPVPINSTAMRSKYHIGSSDSHGSAPGTSHDSPDMGDTLEQPSTDCMTRIKSLQECASVITELVNEKIEGGRDLEAFSIQLVILAIWKQALHICHTQAASATEGSPIQDIRCRRSNGSESLDIENSEGPTGIMSQIERDFLAQVEHAERLAKAIEPGNTEMPDALEAIFQSALDFGRHGGVQELMSNMESASALYSKAVRLLVFLLVEAPSLILNPPFSLTNSDRYRLRTYIDILNSRQGYSRSQRISLLKCEDGQGPLTKF